MEIKRGKMGIMCDTGIRNGPYHVRKGAAAVRKMAPLRDGIYEGENETYIEASAENSGSTLYDKEIRDKPRTRHTKRNV